MSTHNMFLWRNKKKSVLLAEKNGITKTCLYYFDPLKPHFYIVKLEYTLFFLLLLKNIDCGYSLELPCQGGSNEDHNLCFEQK